MKHKHSHRRILPVRNRPRVVFKTNSNPFVEFFFQSEANMRVIAFLFLGVQLAYAEKHSLKYFYTAVSGDINFPEFTSVGLVDDQQFTYFDSNTMKTVPKTEWIRQNVEADYWEQMTGIGIGHHQTFKANIKIAKDRFNQSTGVHTFQWMYGCEWDDQTEAKDAFHQFGYDGEDFVSLDFKAMTYISPVQQGIPTVQKWNNGADLEHQKNYYGTVCIEWLKKYLQYGKSSLQKTVSPQVSLLQKDSSSPVACHATGFYPSGITITWQKNGQDHDEDVHLGELLPNEDGTFQKSSTLRVTPDELKKNQFSCVVEHQGETIREILTDNSVLIGIIVGAVVAVILLVVICVTVLKLRKEKKGCFSGFNPVSASDDGSNTSANSVTKA